MVKPVVRKRPRIDVSSDEPRAEPAVLVSITEPRPEPKSARRHARIPTLLVAVILLGFLAHDIYHGDDAPENTSQLIQAAVYFLFLLLLAAAPVTHSLGQLSHVQYRLWQPFLGGSKFIFLQFLGWSLYGIALAGALVFVFFIHYLGVPPPTHMLVGVGSFALLSQVSLLASIGTFSSERTAASAIDVRRSPDDIDGEGILNGQLPVWATGRWNSILAFCLVMASISFLLFALLEVTGSSLGGGPSAHWAPPVGIVATLMFLAAAPITHGVAGRSKYGGAASSYRFFMPFEGGNTFVFLQAFGWICYSLFVLLALFCFYLFLNGLQFIQGLVFTMGTSGLIAQACLVLSLFWYGSASSPRPATASTPSTAAAAAAAAAAAHRPAAHSWLRERADDVFAFCVVNLFYNLPFLEFCALIALSAALQEHAVVLWALFLSLFTRSDIAFAVFCLVAGLLQSPTLVAVAVCCILYWRGYKGDPHLTGARRWPALRNASWIWRCFSRYFSTAVIARTPLSPAATYVLGFHPHGIYPITCLWASLCPEWRAALPGIDFDSLAASIVFSLPVVRDVLMWCGARDVSRQSIENALGSGRSVIIVPGGQREMFLHTNERERVIVVRKHSGFIRMAIRHGTPLVPVFSFGENSILSNIHAPAMQAWTVKHLGFGFPHFPYGRMYTTLPRPVPVTLAVGAPIPVPKVDAPSDELVAEVHARYFAALRQLFEEHKAEAGYPEGRMVFDDELPAAE